jgi:peptide/nickel transport system substrate-binding protein
VIDPAVQDVIRLRTQPGIVIGETIGMGAQFLGFHHARKEFKDARVRQAIRAAIDVEALKSKVMRDTAATGRALYTPIVDGFDPRFKTANPYDLEKAKALLKEAGYANGFSVELDCSSQQPADALCQAITGMLSRVNIKVVYRPLPFNSLLPKLLAGDTSMYVIGWTPASNEPEGVLVSLAHSRTKPGVGEYNFGQYVNPKVDEAIDKGRVEFDTAKRTAYFTEAMLAIDGEAGFVPLIYRKNMWAMRKNVKVVMRPNDVLDLRMVNVE